jgi:hypothetical protein
VSSQDHNQPFPRPDVLRPGEVLETQATTQEAVIAVTSHRVMVVAGERTLLDLSFPQFRRIQFDIERGRPGALVMVPEQATNEPIVLSVPAESLRETAIALAAIGERLNRSVAEGTG